MEAAHTGPFGSCPLSRDNPNLFELYVVSYHEIVLLAVQQVVTGTDQGVFAKLRRLAREAGAQGAVPQDLIAVHLSALATLVKAKPQAMVRACVRHSRLLLVKMIGELALYYRELAMEQR